jgi:hypothetical protein
VPFKATVLRVLIASPGDTVEERNALRETLHDWNGVHGDEGVMLQPQMWERDAVPDLGGHPQKMINEQLVDDADMLIGVFWTKLGTPTPEADSGSVEEIERVAAAGKPVLLYFSRRPVDPRSIDPAEYERLLDARKRFEGRGLVNDFETVEELGRKIWTAMSRTVKARFTEQLRNPDAIADEPRAEVPGGAGGAVIVARLDRFSGHERLAITNLGTEPAEQLRIEVEVEPGERAPTIFLPDKPIGHLPPGAVIDFPTAAAMGDAMQWDLVFTWTDTGGSRVARQSMAY